MIKNHYLTLRMLIHSLIMSNCLRVFLLIILTLVGIQSSVAQRMMMGAPVFHGTFSGMFESEIDPDSVMIKGRVVESLARQSLSKAFMIPVGNDGTPGDTIKASMSYSYSFGGHHRDMSYFRFKVERKDSTYVFDVGCPGYIQKTIVYRVERVGKRESVREMPEIELEREPHKLGEVQVVASKVKFYHRGDTLVYNADAFQLAEGSMLDELIRQLPGVELDKNGVIKVDGEEVESLLLNGKHFFDGDNKLMLENLGAYTVDNVEVYRGQTALEKWVDDPNARKHLTMDVKLKKEYSHGWIFNAQTGYGTEDRYLGRLFASRFGNTSSVTLLGGINNVNDYSGAYGVRDTWSPGAMPSGDSRHHSAGLNYEVESEDYKSRMHGSFRYSGSRNKNINDGSSATYYADNQVFDYRYARSRSRNMNMITSHDMMFDLGRVNLSAMMAGVYSSSDGLSSSLSASFNEEQANVTQEMLETIYGDGSASALAALVNRARTISDTNSKSGDGNVSATVMYKVPRTSDVVSVNIDGRYSTSKSETWNDYMIDYGDRTRPSEKRRQYTDGSPNHNMSLNGRGTYTARLGAVSLDLTYRFSYLNSKGDSYLYELQKLADMGEYGTLPPDYMSAFSAANSYMSHRREISNVFSPNLRYEMKFKNNRSLSLDISPNIRIANRRLDYWRDNRLYNIRHTSSLRESLSGDIGISYGPNAVMSMRDGGSSFSYRYSLNSQLPDMMSLVDITDDSNPLFIREGNPGLKASYYHSHNFSWSIGRKFSNTVDLQYSYSTNSVVQASTYDMSTGVTRTRAENINGNNQMSVSDRVFGWFGSDSQFTFSSNTSVSRDHGVDLMSTNGAAPEKTSADTWSVGERLNFDWRMGHGHTIGVSCDALNRRTNSDREGFNKINAFHINYGVEAMFRLPAGFELATTFNLYTRRGYGSKELDTTDALWNASATYTPKGKRWVFTLNAYDLLRQVSNVHYTVTTTGRSVAYTNTLPGYVIATVQYRFNVQPSKR